MKGYWAWRLKYFAVEVFAFVVLRLLRWIAKPQRNVPGDERAKMF